MVKIQRYGSVTRVKAAKLDYYKELHANPSPQITEMIKKCNISNYSIFHSNGYLFSYFEYTGDDFEVDLAKMAADSETQRWWKETNPCQDPLTNDGQWLTMEQVYFLE